MFYVPNVKLTTGDDFSDESESSQVSARVAVAADIILGISFLLTRSGSGTHEIIALNTEPTMTKGHTVLFHGS